MALQKAVIIFTVLNLIVLTKTLLIEEFESPDYPNPLFESNNDFRKRFLNQRRENLVNGKRVELLDKYLSNSSVFIDGMAHHIIDENHLQWREINEIENEYKNLIQMKGINYTYKRGPYWRTWRKVRYPDGNDKIICYRCMSNINSTSCEYGGYWIIEEKPPSCPYEILSVINDRDVCAFSLFNNTNIEEKCPFVKQFSELTTACDNPIETMLSITKDYEDVSERNLFPIVICNGRDYCEISTSYLIIEEKPPSCPYEILSVINDRDVCAFSLFNNTNIEEKCPFVKQFSELTTACDNPIETMLSITKDYEDVSERNLFPIVICNGRDYCEISTSYLIARDYVTFRIINATNHIIYSRVMKNGGRNYACINCGQINPKTKTIEVSEKPITLDLLNKNKRNLQELEDLPELNVTELPVTENLNDEGEFYNIDPKEIFVKNHKHRDTCQSLKHYENDDDDDFSGD